MGISLHLLDPEGELEAEGDGLGVNAMGAPHHHSIFVFNRLFFEYLNEVSNVLAQQV
jgi:hypothetical protein